MGNCCAQGGCCRHDIPPPETRDASGQILRVNLEYYPQGCCGTHPGVREEFRMDVPPGLSSKGITVDEWQYWMAKLETDVQHNYSFGVCPGIMCCLFCPCMACHYHCSGKRKAQIENWDKDLRA